MRPLEFICFANRSGYAQAAQDYIEAIKGIGKYDLKITLLHANPDQLAVTPERFAAMRTLMQKQRRDDGLQVFHCIPDMQRRVPDAGKTIGFGTFETYDPPTHWVKILNSNDAVICPSKFNVQVFERAGVKKPIFYVPHAVDTSLFHPGVEASEKSDRFTFLFLGTWKRRKGWPQLIEAWFREFSEKDKVELLIKTDRLMLSQQNIRELKQQLGLAGKETAPIKWESKILTERELPSLIKRADCLISPSLGEGFGLPPLQAMSLGVPVAITNFSGPTEFANDHTATLIEPEKFIVHGDMDNIPQFKSKKWANVTPERVAAAMRHVVQNVDKMKEKAMSAVEAIHQKYDYNAVGQMFDSMLETL